MYPLPRRFQSNTQRNTRIRLSAGRTDKKMVNNEIIKHKVVGVHMVQASTVAIEKARLILVSKGITQQQAHRVGFSWASTPQKAFKQAIEICGTSATVAVLKDAARMLPLRKE